MNSTELTSLFSGTALLATFAYIAVQLKSIPEKIWRHIHKQFIFSANIDETTEMYSYLDIWLNANHQNTLKNVSVWSTYDKEGIERVRTGHLADIFIIRHSGKRLLIRKEREKLPDAKDKWTMHYNSYKIEGWGAKTEIHALLEEILEYNRKLKQSPKIWSNNSSYPGNWVEVGEIKGKTIENVFLQNKEDIITDIEKFLSKEEWYVKRGIPYKRGYLLYGPPGNGKTSFAIALAKYFNRDIFVLNMNDLTKDSSLIDCFSHIKHKSILLIEDIDSILGNRKSDSKLSFSALLNCMDGIYSKHGLLTIITTNHIDKLDSALIREGRIDIKVPVDNPDIALVNDYINMFYGDNVAHMVGTNMISMAAIQDVLLKNTDPILAIESIESNNHIQALQFA